MKEYKIWIGEDDIERTKFYKVVEFLNKKGYVFGFNPRDYPENYNFVTTNSYGEIHVEFSVKRGTAERNFRNYDNEEISLKEILFGDCKCNTKHHKFHLYWCPVKQL